MTTPRGRASPCCSARASAKSVPVVAGLGRRRGRAHPVRARGTPGGMRTRLPNVNAPLSRPADFRRALCCGPGAHILRRAPPGVATGLAFRLVAVALRCARGWGCSGWYETGLHTAERGLRGANAVFRWNYTDTRGWSRLVGGLPCALREVCARGGGVVVAAEITFRVAAASGGRLARAPRTDLGAEVNRSRCGSEPISTRSTIDLGERVGARGGTGGAACDQAPTENDGAGRRRLATLRRHRAAPGLRAVRSTAGCPSGQWELTVNQPRKLRGFESLTRHHDRPAAAGRSGPPCGAARQ